MKKLPPSGNSPKAKGKPWNPLAGLTQAKFNEARLKAEKSRLPIPVVFPQND